MCGIAGAVGRLSPTAGDRSIHRDGLVESVNRISGALRHRGPDGHGLWRADAAEVVFAHRRLAILDLSEAGAQPMVDPESGCVVTFNGEIYNFRELRRDLEQRGESFRSSSDTEVLLKAYKCWGLACVPKLRGIFSFAIWDPRSRCVHLARDHLGIKPLYWVRVRDGSSGGEIVLFASEVRALLASGAVARRLDPAGVASYLAQGFVIGPDTILEDVRLLPAATTLSIAPDESHGGRRSVRESRFWQLPASGATSTTVDELREQLAATVRMQLVSDAPLGIFLSGGIDSSAVAALASHAVPDSIHTFTIGFEEAALDESRHAAQVAQAIGSRHTSVVLREAEFVQHLPDALAAIDQPTFDALNTYFVSRAAREAGMTVALAGTGGDELFGGYPSFSELPKMLRATSAAPRWVNGAVARAASSREALSWNLLGRAPGQTRWAKIGDVATAAGSLLGLYQTSYALFTQATQRQLAGARVRVAQRAQQYGLPAAVAADWGVHARDGELLHAISRLELSSFIGERLLRDTDTASMAVALEVRVPLLDPVLCQAVSGVEPSRRFLPHGRKQLLRDVALSGLDPSIFDRPKSGFVLPIEAWSRRSLQAEMGRVLTDAELVSRVGLRPEAVRMLWRSYLSGRPGWYWSRPWALYVLLTWCERHDVELAA
jgi:asparagine synthase (glutamine-hydrolysing)